MEIEGTVTISIETLEYLKNMCEAYEKLHKETGITTYNSLCSTGHQYNNFVSIVSTDTTVKELGKGLVEERQKKQNLQTELRKLRHNIDLLQKCVMEGLNNKSEYYGNNYIIKKEDWVYLSNIIRKIDKEYL